jgi:hypothetical protein
MNLERAAMKGRLAEARAQKAQLENKVRALAEAMRPKLNLNLLADPADLDILALSSLMEELVIHTGELLAVKSEISRLEKELE